MKSKDKPVFVVVGIVIAVSLFFGWMMPKKQIPPKAEKPKTVITDTADGVEDARQKLIESQFSQWDGSHRKLTAFVKLRLNDPQSFEHVETHVMDAGSHLRVYMTFRAKNPFGALVLQTISARVNVLSGEVLSVEKV